MSASDIDALYGLGAVDADTAPAGQAMGPAMTALRLERRRRFVRAYVEHGGNATAAAISAGYSRARAACTGSELLQVPQVKAAIRELSGPGEARQEAAGQEELRVADLIIRADVRRLFDQRSRLLPAHQLAGRGGRGRPASQVRREDGRRRQHRFGPEGAAAQVQGRRQGPRRA